MKKHVFNAALQQIKNSHALVLTAVATSNMTKQRLLTLLVDHAKLYSNLTSTTVVDPKNPAKRLDKKREDLLTQKQLAEVKKYEFNTKQTQQWLASFDAPQVAQPRVVFPTVSPSKSNVQSMDNDDVQPSGALPISRRPSPSFMLTGSNVYSLQPPKLGKSVSQTTEDFDDELYYPPSTAQRRWPLKSTDSNTAQNDDDGPPDDEEEDDQDTLLTSFFRLMCCTEMKYTGAVFFVVGCGAIIGGVTFGVAPVLVGGVVLAAAGLTIGLTRGAIKTFGLFPPAPAKTTDDEKEHDNESVAGSIFSKEEEEGYRGINSPV